ncbi:MAG: 2-oxoacid:acceptor oxidoreductase family protein [Chloroflexi bacterium]|nr:2-oxoacid:acceptor oxidoreductase family protein [Chloroflexota bacterium]
MQTEVIISGFGGQGALFAGQLLAYAAMEEGEHVTWLPSYGPEMRGGTAHCVVIVSSEEIGAPVVRHPRAVIAMNNPSLDKYEPLVAAGGLLVVNTSLTARPPARTDIRSLPIPANEIAEELGDARLANIVLLGGLLSVLPVVRPESVLAALEKHLPERHRNLLKANAEALRRGAEIGASESIKAAFVV